MAWGRIFAVLKLAVSLSLVNREIISICYNECYKGQGQRLKYLLTASVRLCT